LRPLLFIDYAEAAHKQNMIKAVKIIKTTLKMILFQNDSASVCLQCSYATSPLPKTLQMPKVDSVHRTPALSRESDRLELTGVSGPSRYRSQPRSVPDDFLGHPPRGASQTTPDRAVTTAPYRQRNRQSMQSGRPRVRAYLKYAECQRRPVLSRFLAPESSVFRYFRTFCPYRQPRRRRRLFSGVGDETGLFVLMSDRLLGATCYR